MTQNNNIEEPKVQYYFRYVCIILINHIFELTHIVSFQRARFHRVHVHAVGGWIPCLRTQRKIYRPSPVGARSASRGIIPAACKMLSVLCKLTAIQAATESE
ncbi:hypothetical protein P5V15_014397 [Pogonomyrmex californicus]